LDKVEKQLDKVWESGRKGKVILILLGVLFFLPLAVNGWFVWIALFEFLPKLTSLFERATVLGLLIVSLNSAGAWFYWVVQVFLVDLMSSVKRRR
jgi:hypothetical protein